MSLNQQIERWIIEQRVQCRHKDRPFVTLSYAQSWDGSITLHSGESLALSGDQSLMLTHQLRSIHDGILVGIGTVLSDNPRLNVRQCPGPDPQPIVLDANLRIPPDARLCHLSDKRCWVMTSSGGLSPEHTDLEIIRLPGDAGGRVCLHEAMLELKQRGIHSLMVEGGANVITGFLKQKLVDAMVLTVAPRLVGGYKAVADLEFGSKEELPQISPMFSGMLGDDLIMWGKLQYNITVPATDGNS
ncbi:MAG: RibD family protein [Pseudohongiella sp.]|nr:RibD family protein [Pseudohongiella sp.]MDO9520270.1 RibD family protein [Pseudohongiella sp.]MDP2127075.1 RibD family protein [Pseudohongiella sp.]